MYRNLKFLHMTDFFSTDTVRESVTNIRYADDMLTLKCCQDHILTENIWFVCSETSYSGDERTCHRCGTNDDDEQLKIELLSQWKLEAESRNNLNKKETQFQKEKERVMVVDGLGRIQ